MVIGLFLALSDSFLANSLALLDRMIDDLSRSTFVVSSIAVNSALKYCVRRTHLYDLRKAIIWQKSSKLNSTYLIKSIIKYTGEV
jgi:hypothetical protein